MATRFFSCFASTLAVVHFSSFSSAAVFPVKSTADSGPDTLRAAIASANAAPGFDVIDFSMLPADAMGNPLAITLTTDELQITDSLRVVNKGAKQITVQRSDQPGTPAFRIFNVVGNEANPITVAMHGLNIRNGDAVSGGGGAGIQVTDGTGIALSSMSFEENRTLFSGGAIYNDGSMRIYGSTFDMNVAFGGGAVRNDNILNVLNSTFIRNRALDVVLTFGGGAIVNFGQMRVYNSTFCLNEATTSGGGIVNISNGTIPNLLSNVLVDNTDSGKGPDLRDAGTITAAEKNVVESPMGHTLDPTLNQIGVALTCTPGDHGGPTITTTPPGPGSADKDSGSNSEGLPFDQRGGFRNRGLVPDAGASESGNLFFQGSSNDWFDLNNWSNLSTPSSADSAWISGGQNVDLSAGSPPPSADIDVLGIGFGGGVNAAGSLSGAGVDLNANQIVVGGGHASQAVFGGGVGSLNLSDASVQSTIMVVGDSVATLDNTEAEGDGSVTLSGGSTINIQINDSASIGTATAIGNRTTATSSGALNLGGGSATIGDLQAGNAFSQGNSETAAEVASASIESMLSGNLQAQLWTNGNAFSAGGLARVGMVQSHTTAQSVAADNLFAGVVQTSAFPGGAIPEAIIDSVDISIDARQVNIANSLTLASVSASGSGPANASIGQTTAAVTATTLDVNNVALSAIFAASDADTHIGPTSLTINADQTNLQNTTNVGTLTLSNGASGVIEDTTFNVNGGTYSTAGGFAPDLRIATVDVFTPVDQAQTTATVFFNGVVVNIERDVEVATTNSAGVGGDSSADGTLQLVDSDMSVGGDVMVAVDTGAAPITAGVGTVVVDISYLDITGDLLLGERAKLDFIIEGLTRSEPGSLGDFGAIDAANATLDGELQLDFNFVAVQSGDSFELLSLDEGGTFTGFFDNTAVTGLPAGLTAEAVIFGESLLATVIADPSLPGDYNHDGIVDAADYVVWRKTGINGQQGYNDWRANFGRTTGFGPSFNTTVPEPATLIVMSLAIASLMVRRGCAALCVPETHQRMKLVN